MFLSGAFGFQLPRIVWEESQRFLKTWETKTVLKNDPMISTLMTDEVEVLIQENRDKTIKTFDSAEILHQIQKNKIDKLFINHKNNEILTLDKIPSDHMFHLTKINPVEFNTLVKTSYDYHVSIYYTDFTSSWFIHNHHVWDILQFVPLVYFLWRIFDELSLRVVPYKNDNLYNHTRTRISRNKTWWVSVKKMFAKFLLRLRILSYLLFRN
jgi:hypothetical protein